MNCVLCMLDSSRARKNQSSCVQLYIKHRINNVSKFKWKHKGYSLKEWRSGLAHSNVPRDSSTTGLIYESKTSLDGNPVGRLIVRYKTTVKYEPLGHSIYIIILYYYIFNI